MSLIDIFKRKKSTKPAAEEHLTMADFLARAEKEIDALIRADEDWYAKLPYPGAVSRDEARQMEIERLAIRNRVIYDAGRSRLPGLRWDCRKDAKSCDLCRERHGQIVRSQDFPQLAALPHHLGCRCELIPVRD